GSLVGVDSVVRRVVEEVYMIIHTPLELSAGDMFIRLEGIIDQTAVHLKLEGLNMGGSIKMKTALNMVEQLEVEQVIQPESVLIESSSGNLGLALSLVCAVRGYKFICVTDPNASPQTIRAIRAYGAHVIMVDRTDDNGGFLKSRLALIRAMLNERPELIWLNQYASPANKGAHYRWTAPEILDHFPLLDYLFIGAGTTGTLMGCAEYLREHSSRTKIIAVDSVGSVTFGGPAGRRHIPGLGTSCRPELADEHLLDDIVMIDEIDTIRMCWRVAAVHKFLLGGSSGTVLCGVQKYAEKIEPNGLVVAISPDFGDK